MISVGRESSVGFADEDIMELWGVACRKEKRTGLSDLRILSYFKTLWRGANLKYEA